MPSNQFRNFHHCDKIILWQFFLFIWIKGPDFHLQWQWYITVWSQFCSITSEVLLKVIPDFSFTIGQCLMYTIQNKVANYVFIHILLQNINDYSSKKNKLYFLTHWPPLSCGSNIKCTIFKLIMQNISLDTRCKIALRSMSQNLINEKSTLVQVMAWGWSTMITSHSGPGPHIIGFNIINKFERKLILLSSKFS